MLILGNSSVYRGCHENSWKVLTFASVWNSKNFATPSWMQSERQECHILSWKILPCYVSKTKTCSILFDRIKLMNIIECTETYGNLLKDSFLKNQNEGLQFAICIWPFVFCVVKWFGFWVLKNRYQFLHLFSAV